MAKFMYLYAGLATDMADMSEADVKKVMDAWSVWIESVGDALVDVGTPLVPHTTVVDDGSDGQANDISGYSIVEAADINAAKKLAESHPYLSKGSGEFRVDIYEMMPTPDM